MQRKVVKKSFDTDLADFEAASPRSRVSAAAPPFLISHGTNDAMIPVETGRAFAHDLRAVARKPVVYVELPRAQHAFDVMGTPRAARAACAVADFLGVVYGQAHVDA